MKRKGNQKRIIYELECKKNIACVRKILEF